MATQIPFEYQSQITKAQRKRKLAEAMLQSSMQGPQIQQSGPVAAKISPFAALASLGSIGLNAFAANKADKQEDAATQQYSTDRQAEMGELTGLSGQDQVKRALASKFPDIQTYGMELQKRHDERTKNWSGVVDKRDPQAAANAIASNEIPQGYEIPPLAAPAFGKSPEGNEVVTTMDENGSQNVQFAPKAQQVNVDTRIAGKEGETALQIMREDLKERQGRALVARDALSANRTAIDALGKGAKSGSQEGLLQELRKVGTLFGINLPETAPTEELRMALGQGILARARQLAPVTAEDVKRLEVILGGVNTDTNALPKMLTVYNAIAAKELQDYQRYVQTQGKSLTNENARNLFSGQEIGFEQPNMSGIPWSMLLGTMQELKARGGDVTQFGFEPDATFDIPNPGMEFPNVSKKSPPPVMTLQDYMKSKQPGAK